MIYLAGIASSMDEARLLAEKQISSGKALQKFGEMVKSQGGNPEVINDYSLLPKASCETPVISVQDGYIHSLDVFQLGNNVCLLGGGRKLATDQVDHAVGILSFGRIGMKVKKGDVLAIIQHHEGQNAEVKKMAEDMSRSIYKIKKERPRRIPGLILEVQSERGLKGKGI